MDKSRKRNRIDISESDAQREWDDYFMTIACLVANKSKDPATKVGACLVSPDNKIVGTGFNGMPHGRDDDFTWNKNKGLDSKYLYVCHAELNAIVNKSQSDLRGCKIYASLFPCNECAKLIVQSGIVDVIYLSDKYGDLDNFKASRKIFETVGIKPRQHQPNSDRVIINYKDFE